MEEDRTQTERPESVDGLGEAVVRRYRSTLLDLSSRDPLVNFRHSERSRSHIRVVDEIPELLFSKLEAGRELAFETAPDPVLIPHDELTADFGAGLRRAKLEGAEYREALTKLGPCPSDRQKKKLERKLRDRASRF